MLEHVKRFDTARPPQRQHLGWLIRLLSIPTLLRHRNRLRKIRMEGVKAPYFLLCNHNAFMDFLVASKAIWPARANFIVAIDGFLKREWLLRFIGCICTRKFTVDLPLVKNMLRAARAGNVVVLYPEARYSLCGTTAVIPDSVGKLAKKMGIPVVVLLCHGHHINSPFWNLRDRGVKGTEAEMTCLLTAEELKRLSVEEINRRIREAFVYDEYAWQKARGVRVTAPWRAEGLHKVLYQCPCCGTEYRMRTAGTKLFCESCGSEWEMTELGELRGLTCPTRFSHIPDWYEWERENVRREVESGRYAFSCAAHVDALPKDRFIPLGKARLTHDMSGFTLETEREGPVHIPAQSQYSCHIEYEYLGKHGDCIDLNTPTDTLYIYPEDCAFSVTKFALATEELYAWHHRNREASAP